MKHFFKLVIRLVSSVSFKILLLHLLAAQSIQCFAQADTIDILKKELVVSKLRPGLHQYLVYFENPAKKRIGNASVWNRHVSFGKLNGKDVIKIEQHWYMNDTTFNRYVYSINDKQTFAPIFHKTKMRGVIEAFDFNNMKVTGSDSVDNNVKKDFDIPLTAATLNWELDLEIFSTFPISRVGQRLVVNFYHPGGRSQPNYYEYVIVGSEKIQIVNDLHVDCWKMKINYSPDTWAIFWISKKSKEVLKMQEYFRGGYRYKIRFLAPIEMQE